MKFIIFSLFLAVNCYSQLRIDDSTVYSETFLAYIKDCVATGITGDVRLKKNGSMTYPEGPNRQTSRLGTLGKKEYFEGNTKNRVYKLSTQCRKYGSFHYKLSILQNKNTIDKIQGEAFYRFPFLAAEVDEDESNGNLAYLSIEYHDEKNSITFRIGNSEDRTLVKLMRQSTNPDLELDLDNTPTLTKKK